MIKTAVGFLLILIPGLALAYSDGPPDGKTGAPGEGTCVECHSTFPLNSGDGSFSISGPAQFEAGQTYAITIEISDPGQLRWGFEFTPLDQGTITITDATNTQLSSSGGRFYVKHTSSGTYAGFPDGPADWSFDWTAPANPPESITFYAAGNAADYNGLNTGDYIYTTTFTTTLLPTAIGDDPFASLPSHLSLHNYPNPFNAQTTINYRIPVDGQVRLDIYNLQGQLVASPVNSFQQAGEWSVIWNAGSLPSGLYLYSLTVGENKETQKMMLLK